MHNRTLRRLALLAVACGSGLLGFAQRAGAEVTEADYATLPGFKLQIVLAADPKENGSWISMSKDPQGRLYLGGQRRQPITRVTLGPDGGVAKQEVLHLPVSEVMGQAFVGDTLYVDAHGKTPEGHEAFGLFRLRDPKGDGSFDSVEFLREWQNGAGEHGSHAIVVAPDKQHLYCVAGNFTGVPADLAPTSPHKNYQDDQVLPRAEDGNGFGAGKKPPGGFICRVDLDGKNAELFASGQRNTYGIAMNADGELFGFDSDMEWDWGTPWYRPIRVFHATSGGDGGFREGSAKWPEYYFDSLPAVVDIGIGCPTEVAFGYGAKFPAKYQKAFYITDWTYGRLIAVHLKPHGASYESTGWEDFVEPAGLHGNKTKSPLNLTGVVVGDDGALYFTVGGRGTPAKLFRVTYTGTESTAPAEPRDADGADARELRHQLEAFHGRGDAKAVEFAWPHLDSPDRYISYAARIAIESQPLEAWQTRALSETRPNASLVALLALARVGPPEVQPELLNSLERLSAASLDAQQQLNKLRVIEVSIARQGKPAQDVARPLLAELDPMYPAKSVELNRELCQVLLALGAPDAVAKTVALLQAAPTQEEQLTYVLALRTIKEGWTPELRRTYFSWWTHDRRKDPPQHPQYVTRWFEEAGRPYGDGSSFNNFLSHLHADARQNVPPDEMASLSDVINAFVPVSRTPKKTVQPRKLVKEWTMEDLEPSLPEVSHGRKFRTGKTVFEEAQCISCHKFGNEGGAVGPDLTAISSRFQRRDILESIILPSKVISEQFMNTEVRTNDGDVQVGRLLQETADKLILQPNPLQPGTVTVKKSDIQLRRLSKISPMPVGLVNNFTKEEILDLLAYLESGGNREHADFAR